VILKIQVFLLILLRGGAFIRDQVGREESCKWVKRRHLKKDLRKWVCSSSLRHYENTYERLYMRNRLSPDTKHAGILIMYLEPTKL
jgi:hypothetical protein